MGLRTIIKRAERLMSTPYSDLEELGFLPNRPYDSPEGRGVVSAAAELLEAVSPSFTRSGLSGIVPDVSPEGMVKRHSVRIVEEADGVFAECSCADGGRDLNPCAHKVALLARALLSMPGAGMSERDALEAAHMMLCVFVFEAAVRKQVGQKQ